METEKPPFNRAAFFALNYRLYQRTLKGTELYFE
jgi:hypothetical protein